MEKFPPKPMTPLDEFVTPPFLYTLKLLLPYVPTPAQRSLAIFLKFFELKKTIEIFYGFDRGRSDVSPEAILSDLKPYMNPDEQEMMEQPVPDDDFAVPEDAPYVEKDLKKQAVGLFVRSVIMVILTLVTAYLVFSIKRPPFADLIGLQEDELLGLPFEIIYPDLHPRVFMGVLLGL